MLESTYIAARMQSMVTEELITELASKHGGTVSTTPPANFRIDLPNGAVVSIGYGAGHYSSARGNTFNSFADLMAESSLPQEFVEVAYWHPQVGSRRIDWDVPDGEDERWVFGEYGGLLPHEDVHGWQSAEELAVLVEVAAELVPEFSG